MYNIFLNDNYQFFLSSHFSPLVLWFSFHISYYSSSISSFYLSLSLYYLLIVLSSLLNYSFTLDLCSVPTLVSSSVLSFSLSFLALNIFFSTSVYSIKNYFIILNYLLVLNLTIDIIPCTVLLDSLVSCPSWPMCKI